MKFASHTLTALLFSSFSCSIAFVQRPSFYRKSLVLHSSKPDEARVQQELESDMGDDWRLFRAKLIAQEQQNLELFKPANQVTDAEQIGQLGELFADSVLGQSGIFENSHEAVMPRMAIDEQRWSHSIPHIEPGCVLLASEQVGGFFQKAVVLIIDHHETGSIGVIINRPVPGTLDKVASETESYLDPSIQETFEPSPVTLGGPVFAEEYCMLHGFGGAEGARKVAPGVFAGGSEALQKEVQEDRLDPRSVLFVKGHSAWAPGMLTQEVEDGIWYPAAVAPDLILRYATAPVAPNDNPNNLWTDIMTALGGEYEETARRFEGYDFQPGTPYF